MDTKDDGAITFVGRGGSGAVGALPAQAQVDFCRQQRFRCSQPGRLCGTLGGCRHRPKGRLRHSERSLGGDIHHFSHKESSLKTPHDPNLTKERVLAIMRSGFLFEIEEVYKLHFKVTKEGGGFSRAGARWAEVPRSNRGDSMSVVQLKGDKDDE